MSAIALDDALDRALAERRVPIRTGGIGGELGGPACQ
jgi:hypothetical protein